MRKQRTPTPVLTVLQRSWASKRRRRRVTPETALARKLEAAAQLINRGIQLVPLHGTTVGGCTCSKGPNCERPGKHPATSHGIKDATGNLDAIQTLLTAQPGLNLAVATGKGSGVVVLDIDRRSGGDESFAALEAALGTLPPTWTLRTGDGAHLYFAYPEGTTLRTRHGRDLGPGLDLQSDEAYAVTATSRHQTGVRYHWLRGLRPQDMSVVR